MTPQRGGLVRSRDKLNTLQYISACRRPTNLKLVQVLTCREMILPPLKPHDPLIKWSTSGHVTIWSFYIFTSPRPMATKRGRNLSYRRMFSRLKPSLSHRLSHHWLFVVNSEQISPVLPLLTLKNKKMTVGLPSS